jgi:hypothetical protein
MLIATLGSVNSNSYVTLDEADVYFENRMHSGAWFKVQDQEPFLISASAMLDWSFTWKGKRSFAGQSMQWPRTGAIRPNGEVIDRDIIPQEIKIAVFELALDNLDSDRTLRDPLSGIGQLQAGSLMIKASFKETNTRQSNDKIIPHHVFGIVSDLYHRGGSVWLLRA